MEEREIKKVLKVSSSVLIWAVVILIIAALLIGIGIYMDSPVGKEAESLHDLIYNGEDKEGKYAKITAAYVPYVFAVEETEDGSELNYYFITDNEDYLYIARLTDETYREMERLSEEQGENFSYELQGFVYYMPQELKDLAIEVYNEAYEEEVLTEDNLAEYVGYVYLDETITPQTENSSALIGIGIILLITSIILFIIFIVYKVRGTRVDKSRLEHAKEELAGGNLKLYSKQKIYLTDSYVISNYNGLYILEYREILWQYILINYYRGVATGKNLVVYTSSNKRMTIGHSNNVNNQTIEEIMDKIKEKNPEVRIGFTDENKEYFKQYKKGNV